MRLIVAHHQLQLPTTKSFKGFDYYGPHHHRRLLSTLRRRPDFARLSQSDLQAFQSILGVDHVITEPDEVAPHNRDWTHKYGGQAQVVLRPANTAQVSQVLRYCNERGLAVVPQGGNTGLVGGGVPVFDEVILWMGRMNRILGYDQMSGIVQVEAGCILAKLEEHLQAHHGAICPLDLGAKGTCQIGGNLATNAGGLRVLRYGGMRANTIGVEAVLADGTILAGATTNRKDNTGYDLGQLLIGSEGTLGVITAASLLTYPQPKASNVALLRLPSYAAIGEVLRSAKSKLGEILSAFEFWDTPAQRLLMKHRLISIECEENTQSDPFFVLVETRGSDPDHDKAKMEEWLEGLMGATGDSTTTILDGVLAMDETQAQRIWAMREGIPEACAREGIVLKYDVSLPPAQLYTLVEAVRERLESAGITITGPLVSSVIGYGHVGDGNLHLNVAIPEKSNLDRVTGLLEPFVYEQVQGMAGSISAEHGIGVMKTPYLHLSKPPPMIELMRRVKGVFDPKGILNPYKVIYSSD